MQWIHQYQLFLFDFDGLLVNTEILHFQAYQSMCIKHGYHLDWSFERYSEAAHHHQNGLKDAICSQFPALKTIPWKSLYEEKRQAFMDLLTHGHVQLMPGSDALLSELEKTDIKRCVVTNSPLSLTQKIRHQNPILNSIPYWITREDYVLPKPNPECYQVAIERFAKKGDKIIGFEDSPKGLNALLHTSAKAVLICPPDSPYLQHLLNPSLAYYQSFTSINEQNHP